MRYTVVFLLFIPLLVGCDTRGLFFDGKASSGGDTSDSDASSTSVSTLTAFNLVSIDAVSGDLKTLKFVWEPSQDAQSYSLCRRDTSQPNNCQVLQTGNTGTELEYTLEEVVTPTLTEDDFFVLAVDEEHVLSSSEMTMDMSTYTALSGYIKASNMGSSDAFGGEISMSADGMTMAVSARQEGSGDAADPSDNSKSLSGAVYIFVRNGNVWTEDAYIKADVIDSSDRFGTHISLSDDGQRLAVSTRYEDSADQNSPSDNSVTESGAAYVFDRSGSTWTQTAYLKASNPEQDDFFGTSVDLSGDGLTLAVGATYEDSGDPNDQSDNSESNSGAVYIYTINAGVWGQTYYLKASNAGNGDNFGQSLALDDDGDMLVVGAMYEDSADSNDPTNNSAPKSGAVYVYSLNGGVWIEDAYIKASNPEYEDGFGVALAMSRDEKTLAVVAQYEDSGDANDESDNGTLGAGAVYVYTFSGGVWTQQAYVKVPAPSNYDYTGSGVSLSDDGNLLVFGSVANDSGILNDPYDKSASDVGAVYIYERENQTWSFRDFLQPNITGSSDRFGMAIGISGDGKTLAVGTSNEDSNDPNDPTDNSASSSGAIYVF
ncbi:FG-GAP repeat protein [Enterovibrio norvegicus]|uniref:FG-GAP repeat protein n=1 Tax=Enterovibrio norvegicus TaxID=188144 RepID=UPI000C86080A|nr:FG-GAP repeat protein [Enterovibrio norvegicus]